MHPPYLSLCLLLEIGLLWSRMASNSLLGDDLELLPQVSPPPKGGITVVQSWALLGIPNSIGLGIPQCLPQLVLVPQLKVRGHGNC